MQEEKNLPLATLPYPTLPYPTPYTHQHIFGWRCHISFLHQGSKKHGSFLVSLSRL